MTNTNLNHFVVILLTGSFLLFGCSQEYTSASLNGKWQETKMVADMPELKDLSPAIIKAGEELALSTTYEFNADGSSIETSNYYPEGIPGKWTYNSDSMTLNLISTDEAIPSESYYTVAFHSKRKMTLLQNYQEMGSLKMELVRLKK